MNGTDYLLDTNIVIGFLGGRDWATSFIKQKQSSGASFALSQISRMELLSFPGITEEEEEAVKRFLSNVEVLRLSDSVESRAIRLRRETHLKLPDAIIVATAMEVRSVLVTCDDQLAALDISGISICNARG